MSLPRELDGLGVRAARREALDALEEVDLADLADRFPDDMSGGQQQRVAIARALVGERRLILADEPTGALDSETGEAVLRLLRRRCDAGAAGILVTHEARHAAWADRVVFLRDGLAVDQAGPIGGPEQLLEDTGGPVKGWTVPLRVARRDALRSRGRSALIVAMIAIPVLGLGAVDVLFRSITVDTHERVDLEMGTRADAWIRFSPAGDNTPIEQSVAADRFDSRPDAKPLTTVQPLASLLPAGSHIAVVDSAAGLGRRVGRQGRQHRGGSCRRARPLGRGALSLDGCSSHHVDRGPGIPVVPLPVGTARRLEPGSAGGRWRHADPPDVPDRRRPARPQHGPGRG